VIVSVGLSHREAPIEVREVLSLERDKAAELLRSLAAEGKVREAVCLSTCNRTEIYAAAAGDSHEQMGAAAAAVAQALETVARERGSDGVTRHLSTRTGPDAVKHLFRVAASLDSLVVGEPQILGQVKDAFDLAREAGTLGQTLERAMSRALHVAKRVRTETAIGAGQVSVPSVAVELARQIFGSLSNHTVLLLGAGDMAETAAKLLVKAGSCLLVVNRSFERGEALAQSMGGAARPWEDLAASLAIADVVVASTSARGFVVTRPTVHQAMRARKGRSLFFIDIAVPRDIDPEVNDIDNVYLYDIDNLSQTVAESMADRRAEAEHAEALVAAEARAFGAWTEERSVAPTIVALRAKVRGAIAAELDKSLAGKLKHLSPDDRAALDTMVEAATKKLVHSPISQIKALAADPRGEELVAALHLLFGLDDPEAKAPAPPADSAPRSGDAEPMPR
jgi:glutamyl-tRNA reductase